MSVLLFIHQLVCSHCWVVRLPNAAEEHAYPPPFFQFWQCRLCGKKIIRKEDDVPIRFKV
jgi:hypothetical protein